MKMRIVLLIILVALLALMLSAFASAPLSVTSIGGCKDGPYTYNKDDPGGHNGGVCRDVYGKPAVDDCCCFVASASGLSHEQITTLRKVRNMMLTYIPGFTWVNDQYHLSWGPSVANYLRTHPRAMLLSHYALTSIADVFALMQ